MSALCQKRTSQFQDDSMAYCRSLMSINMFTAPARVPEASYSGVGNGMNGTRVPSGRSAIA